MYEKDAINVGINSKENWAQLKRKLETEYIKNQFINHIESKQFRVYIENTSDDVRMDAQISDLMYFFPILDFLIKYHKANRYELFIDTNHIDKKYVMKIKQFLCLQADNYKRYLDVIVEHEHKREPVTLANQVNFGRLLPLLSVNEKNYATLFKKGINGSETIDNIHDIFMLKDKISSGTKDNELKSIHSEIEKLIVSKKYINSNFYNSTEEINVEKLFFLNSNDKLGISLSKMCLSNIYSCFEMSGTKDDKIDSETKSLLRTEFKEFINRNVLGMPLLTQVIWSIIVLFIVEQKELISPKVNDKRHIQSARLKKALIDAQAYSEGIFQLAENSCIHTELQTVLIYLRVYEVDRKIKTNELENVAQKLMYVDDKYKIDKVKYTINKDWRYLLEIRLLDNAFNANLNRSVGIVEKFNERNERRVVTLSDIYDDNKESGENNTEIPLEDYIIHYGLKLFKSLVMVNRGCFLVSSPQINTISINSHNEKYLSLWNHITRDGTLFDEIKNNSKNEDVKNSYSGTEYNILLPITYSWYDYKPYTKEAKYDKNKHEMFDHKFLKRKDIHIIEHKTINEWERDENLSKSETAQRICQNIESTLNVEKEAFKDKSNFVHFLHLEDYDYKKTEILAKGIFSLIYNIYKTKNSEENLFIALMFEKEELECIGEFVRIYSIFYDKVGENKFMEKVQIALCSKDSYELPHVNFLLAGKDLSSAYLSAKIFSFYNAEASHEYTSLLKYLTRKEMNNHATPPSQFPFDLVLNEKQLYMNHKDGEANSWFDMRIDHALNSSITNIEHGCKIENIHLSIGSKIHTDTFYEAELLFHNIGNIYRFAYKIAGDLINHTSKNKNNLIVGYENYSKILVQEVTRILEQDGRKISYAIYNNESDNLSFVPDRNKLLKKADNKCTVSVIIPIASTLSTVYKIYNKIKNNKKISKELKIDDKNIHSLNKKNIVMILSADPKKAMELNYWDQVNTGDRYKEIVLNKEKHNEENQEVVYYHDVTSNWHSPEEDDELDHMALIDVDKTSTIPNSIFLLNEKLPKIKMDSNTNDKRIEMLYDCVRYAHIYRDNNHYKFYLDINKLYRHQESEVSKWLESINNEIDDDAYNIVVSPLSPTNSNFLKSVIDCSFKHNMRFLHFPVNDTYKEDVRTKFSYISKEIQDILDVNPNSKIKTYFIDDSIVTANTIDRSRNMLRMLFQRIHSFSNRVRLFDGIILLVNRSSYETINAYVRDPDKDLHKFIQLDVPSMNTVNGKCAACGLTDKYNLMQKLVSAPELSKEYVRLSYKHSVRMPREHDNWLDDLMQGRKTYKEWVDTWISNRKGKNNYNALGKVVRDVYKENEWESYFKRNILTERNYLRLYCSNELYGQLIYSRQDDEKKGENTENKTIYEIIADRFEKIDEYTLSETVGGNVIRRNIKLEWLISYIKIASREPFSQYHHILQDIFTLMIGLCQSVFEQDTMKQASYKPIYNIIKDLEEENSEEYCRLMYTILRRLSDLQSSYLINKFDIITKHFMTYFSQLEVSDDKDEKKNKLTNDFILKMIKLVKWSSMSGNDNSKCFQIKNQITSVLMENKSNVELVETDLYKMIFLENNKIIYDGLKKLQAGLSLSLSDSLNQDIKNNDFAAMKNKIIIYVHNEYVNCKSDDIKLNEEYAVPGQFNVMNTHNFFFRFMENGESKTDRDRITFYIDLFGFYYLVKQLNKEGSIIKNPYKYIELAGYIRKIYASEDCVILSREKSNVQMLVTSSPLSDNFVDSDEYTITDYKSIIKVFDEESDSSSLFDVNKVCQKMNYKQSGVTIICVPLLNEMNSCLYICLKNKGKYDDNLLSLSNSELYRLRCIIFLRDSLCKAFAKDMHALQNMMYRYDYIGKVRGNGNVRALHISDLHIQDGRGEDISKALNLVNKVEQIPDLILITGDVIQADKSASNIVQNYKSAEETIKRLVKKVWTDPTTFEAINGYTYQDEKVVYPDWRKRIIITTGNHDYESMNELVSQNINRSTVAGLPSSSDGDLKIKFPYYVDFVRRLLRINTDEIEEHGLNEVRHYSALGLNIIGINTSRGANPLRNNKVGINKDDIKKTLSIIRKNNDRNLVLMHHTPIYKINYLEDVYNPLSSKLNKIYGDDYKSYNRFINDIKDILESDPKVKKEDQDNVTEADVSEPDVSKTDKKVDDLPTMFTKLIENAEDVNKLYDDCNMRGLEYYLNNDNTEDDFSFAFIQYIQKHCKMSEVDHGEYQGGLTELFNQIDKKKSMILGGHYHIARRSDDESPIKVYEAARAYNGDFLYYSTLELYSNEDIDHVYKYNRISLTSIKNDERDEEDKDGNNKKPNETPKKPINAKKEEYTKEVIKCNVVYEI